MNDQKVEVSSPGKSAQKEERNEPYIISQEEYKAKKKSIAEMIKQWEQENK